MFPTRCPGCDKVLAVGERGFCGGCTEQDVYKRQTYDLAIQGDGFFTIRVTDKQGKDEMMYTRCSTFKCTQDGYIVDADGNHLQGNGGDIQVSTDALEIAIKEDGSIYADGQYVDTIALANFADYNYLDLYGDNKFRAVAGATQIDAKAQIEQGYTCLLYTSRCV